MGKRKEKIFSDASERTYIIEVEGNIPSKKNMVRHRYGGGGMYDKSVRSEIDYITHQIKNDWDNNQILGPVRVFTEIVCGGRQDADNIHTTLLDCLQSAGVIKNDRQVMEGGYQKTLTKNPLEYKAKIEIREIHKTQ